MWIALPDSFVSVVQDHDDRNTLVVRARRRDHLVKFLSNIGLVPDIEEDKTGTRDYRFRARIDRYEMKVLMAHHVNQLDWTNFKDEAHARDEELAEMYTDWWFSHNELQEKKYPRGRRRS